MSRQRRQYTKYSSELKAEVALAALLGEQTTSELAKRYDVHPTMVSQWKRELRNNATRVFEKKSSGKTAKNGQEEIDTLNRGINTLNREIDTLNREFVKMTERLDSLVTRAQSLSRSHQELNDATPPKCTSVTPLGEQN